MTMTMTMTMKMTDTLNATKTMARHSRWIGSSLCALALSACSVLSPSATPLPAFYSLNGTPGAMINSTQTPAPAPFTSVSAAQPTLIVNPPRAAAGFDSQRIIYLREAHKLEYFANSEWVDPPARMLGTLLVASLQNTGTFRAVVLAPGTAVGEMRLETEIIRLQQDFQTRPSRVHFTLRANLLNEKTRRVVAWREFDAAVSTATDDPQGGVLAANLAVQSVLKDVATFCSQQAVRP